MGDPCGKARFSKGVGKNFNRNTSSLWHTSQLVLRSNHSVEVINRLIRSAGRVSIQKG